MAKMNYMEPIFFTPPRNKLDRALYKDSPSPAPAPTSQTVTNTSIPEYARPYVETMLGKSQALTDINANPYQTYGGNRIAGFSHCNKVHSKMLLTKLQRHNLVQQQVLQAHQA